MLTVKYTNLFKKDYKLVKKRGLNNGIYINKQIVSSKWIEQMIIPYIKCDEKFAFM